MRNGSKAAAFSIFAPWLAFSSSGFAQDRVPASDGSRASRAIGPASERGAPLIGHLANGVRFAILPRQGQESGVALLMRNEGGFIAERRPGERGLAHLIEHVAFHSPTVTAPEDYDHLKRIGIPLTLPAPNAGSTSWRETNYYLSTKTTASGDIDTLLTVFRDAATGMTLRADAVDASRDEVMREMADKKLGNDIYASYIAALAPGSPNDVIDAQNSDDVPVASIDTIRALYQRLYRPENMMIVIVGNVKPDEMRTLIEKRFGDWKPERPDARRAPFPTFDRRRIQPISFSALPQGRRTALMTVVLPTPAPPSSRDRQMRHELMDMIVARAVNLRLTALQPDSPPGKVGMFIENGEQGQRQIMLWENFADGRWKPAVAGLRRITCDLTTSGFTTEEWQAAKRNLLDDLNRRAEDIAKVSNVDLAKDLSHALADDRNLIPPDALLRYATSTLPGVHARSGSTWWRQQWGSGVEHLRVEAPELAKDRLAVAMEDDLSAKQRANEEAAQQSQLAATVKDGWLVGRWVMANDGSDMCVNDAMEFKRDHTFVVGGGVGKWVLNGRQLEQVGAAGALRGTITAADATNFSLTREASAIENYRRCTQQDEQVAAASAAGDDVDTSDIQATVPTANVTQP